MKKYIGLMIAFLSVFLIGSSGVSAMYVDSVDLDFTTLAPEWGINETWTYTFTSEEKSKNYAHISLYNNQLLVFYYDYKFYYDTSYTYNYRSVTQPITVRRYNLDKINKSFVYANETNWSGNEFSENYVVWSSYKIISTNENDISDLYNDVIDNLDNNSTFKSNMECIISTFYNTFEVPFIVLYSEGEGVQILFTPDGSSIRGDGLGQYESYYGWKSPDGHVYAFTSLVNRNISNMTQSEIIELINNFKTTVDNDTFNKNEAHESNVKQGWVLVWYMSYDYADLYRNQWGTLTWDNDNFPSMIPTIDYKYDFNLSIQVSPTPTPTPDLTDDDVTGATSGASSFFSGFSTDTFGLTSIITAPLNLIKSITSKTCTPLVLQVPFLNNQTINLPCLTPIYQEFFGSFLTIYQTITFGIIAYWVCVRIFALVKDFKNPDSDRIEVLDL